MLCCITAFTVSIVDSLSDNSTNNSDVIEYMLGSDLTVRCLVTPTPPPQSGFSWNCSAGCFDNVTTQQSISISELGLLDNVMITCSVFINDIQYSSETVELNITGKCTVQSDHIKHIMISVFALRCTVAKCNALLLS